MRRRLPVVIATTAVGLGVLSAAAGGAPDRTTRLISIGPTGGNPANDDFALFRGSSDDGTKVFFTSADNLVAEDTDNQQVDIYRRVGDDVTLISTGPEDDGAHGAHLNHVSADGSRVTFITDETLVAEDTDSYADVYQREGDTTTLMSVGPTGGNANVAGSGVGYAGASRDGTRVFFNTGEALVASDTDTATDVYEHSGGAVRLVSVAPDGSNFDMPAGFSSTSDDGEHVLFGTAEPLAASDTDTAFDIYERAGGTTTHVSTGSGDANANTHISLARMAADGSRTLIDTNVSLVSADDDTERDVYERRNGTTTLLSVNASDDNTADVVTLSGMSTDGTRVFMTADHPLAPGGNHGDFDIYERHGGDTTLVSTGPADAADNFEAEFAGASEDGTRVFFETKARLVAGDADNDVMDVYERAAGSTTLISDSPEDKDEPAFFADASGDGATVLFGTDERLTADDTDSGGDAYERTGTTTTLVSAGNEQLNADPVAVSRNGAHAFFHTPEQLVPQDTDSFRDVYGFGSDADAGDPGDPGDPGDSGSGNSGGAGGSGGGGDTAGNPPAAQQQPAPQPQAEQEAVRAARNACGLIREGSDRNDQLQGGPEDDVLHGYGGDDTVLGRAGADCLFGGRDADNITGGEGDDRMYGGAGNDRLVGNEGDDGIQGGDGKDVFYGDTQGGFAGDDRLYGEAGNDVLNGRQGEDVLIGGTGHDRLRGGTADDRLFGQDGNDQLYGGSGRDRIEADAGDDYIHARDGDADVIDCGDGDDRVRADREDRLVDCERVSRR